MLVAFGGSSTFSADGVPSGTTQDTIFSGSGHSIPLTIMIDAGVAA
jgi:ribonuclease T2